MYAVDDLSDAIDVTRNFLTPFRAGTWLRLAILVLFVSSLGAGFPTVPTGDVGTQDQSLEDFEAETGIAEEELLLLIAVIVVIGLLFWLVFGFIGALFEFVFIRSLMTTEVHIRRYAREELWRGVHLFAFRVVAGLISALLIGLPVVWLVWGGVSWNAGTLAAILLVALYALLIFIVYSVIMGLTTEFVAPVMLLQERGILDAWGRFWRTLRANVGEYVVYVVLIWIIKFAASIAAWFVVGIGALVIAIPFAILIVLLVLLGPVGIAAAVPIVVLGILVFLLWLGLVWTPIESYFTYYALLILGDTDPELDLIADQRAAVRADGGDGSAADEPGSEPPADDWTDGDEDWTEGDDGWE